MDIDDIKPNGWPQTKKAVKIIVEAVEELNKTVKEFDDISSVLSLKMTKTIERFEASSSKAANKMIWLTCVIAGLTVVITVLTLAMIFK